MSACQCASVAGTSLSPEGNITATTDVLKIVGGAVNTCPVVLQLVFAAAFKFDFFVLFAQCFFLIFSFWNAGKS